MRWVVARMRQVVVHTVLHTGVVGQTRFFPQKTRGAYHTQQHSGLPDYRQGRTQAGVGKGKIDHSHTKCTIQTSTTDTLAHLVSLAQLVVHLVV